MFSVTSCARASAESSAAETASIAEFMEAAEVPTAAEGEDEPPYVPAREAFINLVGESCEPYGFKSIVFKGRYDIEVTLDKSLNKKNLAVIKQSLSWACTMCFPKSDVTVGLKYKNKSETWSFDSDRNEYGVWNETD